MFYKQCYSQTSKIKKKKIESRLTNPIGFKPACQKKTRILQHEFRNPFDKTYCKLC